jgi:hypothetical protein
MKLLNVLFIFSLSLFALFYNAQSSPTYFGIIKLSKRSSGINPDPKNGTPKVIDSKH